MTRNGKGSGAKTASDLKKLRNRKRQKRSNESENERSQSREDHNLNHYNAL